jgi:hypothetical protein
MTLACTAVCKDAKTGMSLRCIDGSSSAVEINMENFDVMNFEVLSTPIEISQGDCDWCPPPPPKSYKQRKLEISTMNKESVNLQLQQVSRHTKNYRAAVGREIIVEESGQWMRGQGTQRECAAKVAKHFSPDINI